MHKSDIQNMDYAFKEPEVTSLAFYFLPDILESHSNPMRVVKDENTEAYT